MTQNQLSRSRMRARNQHRYVFSLNNSKREGQQRPKISHKFNDGDYSFLTSPRSGNHPPETRAKRTRRNVRLMIVAIMSGTILVFVMDGLLYRENEKIDLFHGIDSSIVGDNKQSTPQLRSGENNMLGTKQRHNRAVDKIEGAEHQNTPVNFNRNEAIMDLSHHSKLYDSIVNDVAEIIKEGSKKLEDMKLVVSFDAASDGSKRKSSSGLRFSPGAPLPHQEIELERNRRFNPSKHMLSRLKTAPHEIAGLQCALYGGPNSELATRDIIYWQDIKSDNNYMSPFFYKNKGMADDDEISFKVARDSYSKYITFEPDPGGFNNNRLAFEKYLALSAAMGRILVIPPRQHIPLLNKGTEKEQNLSMEDFFHLDSMNNENVGVNIITMEEFLHREASSGHFTRYASDDKIYPPYNQTNWDFSQGSPIDELWNYLRTVGYRAEEWNNDCVGAFPSDASGNNILMDMMNIILEERDGRSFPDPLDFQGRPVPPQSPPMERLREILAGRKRLCLYTDEMRSATLVHFPSGKQAKLFMQFYSFIFFEDYRQATWTYRLVRDHLRYKDVIMCAAVRIIKEIEKKSLSASNPLGNYHSIHLRRTEGSFQEQYIETDISTEDLVLSLISIAANSTLFISTDESPDHSIFQALRKKYDVIFLDDYQHLLEGINPNFHGMIEQMIAARADTFFGTYYSTYSGFICRLRGYYAVRDRKYGYNEGKLTNTFYINDQHMREYGIAKAVQKPFFAREFPVAWLL